MIAAAVLIAGTPLELHIAIAVLIAVTKMVASALVIVAIMAVAIVKKFQSVARMEVVRGARNIVMEMAVVTLHHPK